MLRQSIDVFDVLDCIITCVLMMLEIERQNQFRDFAWIDVDVRHIMIDRIQNWNMTVEIWNSIFLNSLRIYWSPQLIIRMMWFVFYGIHFLQKSTKWHHSTENVEIENARSCLHQLCICIKIMVSTTRMCNKLSWKSLGFWMMCQITEWIAWNVNMQFVM